MFRVAAVDDAGFVIAAQDEAFLGAAAGFEESFDLLGNADLRVAAEFFRNLGGIA